MDQQSIQYQLQRMDVGMVWLDNSNHVTAFNDVAWQLLSRAGEETLGVSREQLIGIDLLKLHPQKSRDKLALLLGDGTASIDQCPVQSPPPMTMMINIPDRVLLLKVSKMMGQGKGVVGACMIYYDLTDLTTAPSSGEPHPRQLNKIPIYQANKLVLIDLEDTLRLESNDHYTWIVTPTGKHLSNLSLSDLEERLDKKTFFRCHRSHIVNLRHVHEIAREGETLHIVFDRPEKVRVPVSRSHAKALRDLLGM